MEGKRNNYEELEACFEYLGCRNKTCKLHGNYPDNYCWEVKDTLCNHHGILLLTEKLNKKNSVPKIVICRMSGCIYFAEAVKLGIVK